MVPEPEPAIPEPAPRPNRPSFIDEPRRPQPPLPERRPEPVASFPLPEVPSRPEPRPEPRVEPRSEREPRPEPAPAPAPARPDSILPRRDSLMPRSESMMPRPMRAEPPIRVAPPLRAERPAPAPTPTPPAPTPEPEPVAAAPVSSADQNLAEMAQRLEAALRRPASEARPEPSEPRIGAPPVAPEQPAARPGPRFSSEVSIAPVPRSDAPAAPAVAPPVKTGFENLEDEMASLLGRPKSSS
jgi:hypothetical protein